MCTHAWTGIPSLSWFFPNFAKRLVLSVQYEVNVLSDVFIRRVDYWQLPELNSPTHNHDSLSCDGLYAVHFLCSCTTLHPYKRRKHSNLWWHSNAWFYKQNHSDGVREFVFVYSWLRLLHIVPLLQHVSSSSVHKLLQRRNEYGGILRAFIDRWWLYFGDIFSSSVYHLPFRWQLSTVSTNTNPDKFRSNRTRNHHHVQRPHPATRNIRNIPTVCYILFHNTRMHVFYLLRFRM